MAGLVQNRNFVHQRKLSAKKKHWFSKSPPSQSLKTLGVIAKRPPKDLNLNDKYLKFLKILVPLHP